MNYEGLKQSVIDYAFKCTGIRQEFPGLNHQAAIMLTLASLKHMAVSHRAIEGFPIPKEGPVIVVGNHRDNKDSLEIWWASVTQAHRILRPVVKMSLLEKGDLEPPEYLEQIGSQAVENDYSKRDAFVLRGIGSVGLLRHAPDLAFFRQCHKILENREMLGVFLQPTRNPDFFLKNLQTGPAHLARMHPDAQICPVAFAPDKIHLFEPFTYNQKVRNLNRRINPEELTIMIADIIVAGLPKASQKDWKTRREQELHV